MQVVCQWSNQRWEPTSTTTWDKKWSRVCGQFNRAVCQLFNPINHFNVAFVLAFFSFWSAHAFVMYTSQIKQHHSMSDDVICTCKCYNRTYTSTIINVGMCVFGEYLKQIYCATAFHHWQWTCFLCPGKLILTITCLFSKSILLPSTTKGKFSGSRGLAWIRNSSLQLSSVLKVLGAVTSNTSTQQSAPR